MALRAPDLTELFPAAKTITLLWLKYKNFKGIKEFTLTLDGKNANVYGDNATGKTTLIDGFLWLLFDKDSQGKKDFDIKTLDAANNAIHGLDHEVEACFNINGAKKTLRKVYAEKWVKKRGTVKSEFTGHTTDYFVDGVPVKKNEYVATVDAWVDEEVFKLLTSLAYFNEQLHWQKRRGILLEVCGNISDADVIASDKALAKLPVILGDRDAEKHKKVIAGRRTELNEKIEKIPTRIDEVVLGLPDITGLDAEKLQASIAVLKQTKTNLQEQLLQVQSGGEIARRKVELQGINAELMRLKNEHQASADAAVSEKRKAYTEADLKCGTVKRQIADLTFLVTNRDRKIINLKGQADELRNKWKAVDALQFVAPEQETVCYACGQDLPEDKLAEARTNAEAKFNRDKAEQLEAINEAGQAIMSEVREMEAQNTADSQQINELKAQLEATEQEVARLREDIASTPIESLENNPEYAKELQEKATVEDIIMSLQMGSTDAAAKIKTEIAELDQEIQSNEIFLKQIDDYNKGQVRIEELKAEEKRLAAEFEKLEGELYLIEQFTRTKVAMLDEKINSRFKRTRFKLFEEQINGGLAECCEALVNTNGAWVPYSTANNAGRIESGLDVIDTLSEHYGFVPPIFIDNKEGISVLPEIKAQVISLIKPPTFDELDQDVRDLLVKEHGSEDKARREYNLRNQKLRVEVA